NAIYLNSFLSIDLTEPDSGDKGAHIRWQRVAAAYRAVLYAAGFPMGSSKITFQGNKDLNALCGGLDPKKGLSGDEAVRWFTTIWENYDSAQCFADYKRDKGREWADEDLKAVLVMLTRRKQGARAANVSGYRKLDP